MTIPQTHKCISPPRGLLCYQAGEFIPFGRWGSSPIMEVYLQGWFMGLGAALILVVKRRRPRKLFACQIGLAVQQGALHAA